MDVRCKNCGAVKKSEQMIRQKHASQGLNSQDTYGSFHYGYFCNEGCFIAYDGDSFKPNG